MRKIGLIGLALGFFILGIVGIALASLEDNLVAHYPLDGSEIDVSNIGNDGTAHGAIPTMDRFGDPNSAYSFDGIDDYIEIDDNSAFNNEIENEITISMWIKPNSLGDHLISKWKTSHFGSWAIRIIDDGMVRFGVTSDGINPNFALSTNTIQPGEFHHVAGVYNKTDNKIRIFIDGVQGGIASGPGGEIYSSDSKIYIGAIIYSTQSTFFDGVIDDVRIYSRALSGCEIRQLASDAFVSPNQIFSLEQGTQKNESVSLLNVKDTSQSATLEIINPYPEVGISLVSQDPVTIEPHKAEDAPLLIDAASATVGTYDGILLKITLDDGSIIYADITIHVTEGAAELPDLYVNAKDIGSDCTDPDDPVIFTATISNNGNLPAENVRVQFYDFGTLIGETEIFAIPAEGSINVSIDTPAPPSGDRMIEVVIDPDDAVAELNEENNAASRIVQIACINPGPMAGNILVTGGLPQRVCVNSPVLVSGHAVYDIMVDGAQYTDYVVKGGMVQITTDWASTYGDIHTNINGDFTRLIVAPDMPGTYSISMTVTDNTFSGEGSIEFEVVDCPSGGYEPVCPPNCPPSFTGSSASSGSWVASGNNIWEWVNSDPSAPSPPTQDVYIYSENIHFSNEHPNASEEITIGTEIQYFATSTDLPAEQVPVNIYVVTPGEDKTNIYQTTINTLKISGAVLFANWMAENDGIYIIEVEIDPSYSETNMLNNAATRAIIVGELPGGQGAISGHVSDAVNGVENVVVQLLDANGTLESTVTDSSGFYLFENIPIGDYNIQIIVPAGYYTDEDTKSVNVTEHSITEDVDFQLDRQTAPIAAAGSDQTVNEGITVTLDGSNSSDPENDPLTYQWNQIAGPSVVLDLTDPVRPTFTAPQVSDGGATITFELVVSDGNLTSEPDQVDITVKNVNHPPIADAGPDKAVQENNPVELDGTGSYDPDGDALTYNWIQTFGPTVSLSDHTAAQPSFTAPLVGSTGETLTFELTVNDGMDSAVDTVSITVENVNHTPIADAGSDQTKNEEGMVALDGSDSLDPDNDPLTYQWSQTAGPSVTLDLSDPVRPTFTAPQVSEGGVTLTFELIVNDGELSSEPDMVNINILNLNDPPACEFAHAEPDSLWPPNHKLKSIEVAGVTDPENGNVTITINSVTQDEPVNGLGDGDTGPDAVIQNDNVLLRAERAGGGNGRVYRIGFTADDGSGGVCRGNVSVCVPHDKRGAECIDDGQNYDSLQP